MTTRKQRQSPGRTEVRRGHLSLPRIVALSILMCPAAVHVQAQGKFGFGIVIGQPTGIAWKYRINYVNALDGAIGFSPYDRFRIHVDYLWHARPFGEENLSLHYGVGGGMGFGNEVMVEHGRYFLREQELGFGGRVVAGLTYFIPRSPVDLFFEIAPILIMAPATGLGFDIGLGARFYP